MKFQKTGDRRQKSSFFAKAATDKGSKRVGWLLCFIVVGVLLAAGCGKPTPNELFQSGVEALKQGDLDEGRTLLEAALEGDPDAAFAGEAQNWLGLANWELDNTTEAAARFEYASALNPAAFDPVYNLGCLSLDLGDMSRGISLLRKAADLDAKDTKALLRIGDWTTHHGRWDLARRMYFEAQKRNPQSAKAAAGLGRIALLEGDLPQAETFFMQALEMNKNYPTALYNLCVLYAQQGGHEEQAREYFRKYLELDPHGERAEAAAARIGGQVIEQASFRPEAPAKPRMTVGVYWSQARELLDSGDTENAYLQTCRALELAREGGDAAQSGEILRRALEVFPDRAAIQLHAGEYWLGQDEPRRAQTALLKARALEPDNPMVLLGLARASTALQEYDTTVVSLRRLVELEPGNADALWALADVYGDKLGMTRKGIAAYRDFEEKFPSDPRAAQVADRIQALKDAAVAMPATAS